MPATATWRDRVPPEVSPGHFVSKVGLLAWLVVLSGCKSLPHIESNTCGNAVLEDDEDCDTFPQEGRSCRQPGEVDACRLNCKAGSDGTPGTCPAGSGCTTDGACKRVTGDYQSVADYPVGAVDTLASGDFDGDGRVDILSHEPPETTLRSRLQLHYFDAEARLEESRSFPKSVATPLLADLDDDDRADLLAGDFRIGLLRGRSDREWVPDTFVAYRLRDAQLNVVSVYDGLVGAVSGFVTITTVHEKPGIYAANLDSRTIKQLAPLLAGPERIAGRPVAGHIIEGDASPCAEVVIGMQGADTFSIYDVCRPRRPDDPHLESHPQSMPVFLARASEQVVSLPAGVTLDDVDPVVADIDSDGHVDVLIGAGSKPYLARGDGAGLSASAELYELPFGGNALVTPDIPMPLAAGEFTGDDHVDFVFENRVLSSWTDAGTPRYSVSQINAAEPWTSARIADLNGNGLPDIVAASSRGVGVAYFNGTPGPFQIATRIATKRPVRDLAVEDFDGDLVGDVAFIEQADSPGGRDSLEVAFGNTAIPPSKPLQVGLLEGADRLMRYREEGLGRLLVTSVQGKGGGLTLLDNGSDRLPFAPLPLVTFEYDGSIANFAAVAFSLGAFTRPGAKDVMTLASLDLMSGWGFWLIPSIGHEARSIQLEGELPGGAFPLVGSGIAQAVHAAGSAADVDGDQIDESIWLLPADGGASCVLTVVGADAEARLLVPHGHVAFAEACLNAELEPSDVDRDGFVDLVMLSDRDSSPQLRVLWNDGDGNFSAENASLFGDMAGEAIHDFKLSIDDDQVQLVYVTSSGLFSVNVDEAERSFSAPAPLKDLDRGTAVAIADINGDGPADLVVADAIGLSVLRAALEE